jgi:Ser/Thr protein kinase RdoA (MazF antagonist)
VRPAGLDPTLLGALAHWPLDEVSAIDGTPLGTMNETFLVTTRSAPVVLRRHRHSDRADVLREHDIIAFAAAKGIPTPTAHLTHTGAPVAEHAGRLYSVFAHAAGTQLPRGTLTPTSAAAMGTTLAALHAALADFPPQRCPKQPGPAGPEPTAADTVCRLRALLDAVERWPDQGPDEQNARSRLAGRIDWITAHRGDLAASAPTAKSIATQPIHGDYQEANLFFDAARVVAVIDWDKAEIGTTADEIVRTMALSFALQPACCQAFLAAYRAGLPMPAADLDAAAAAYSARKLHDTWVYDTAYLRGDGRVRQFITPGTFTPFLDSWARLRAELG